MPQHLDDDDLPAAVDGVPPAAHPVPQHLDDPNNENSAKFTKYNYGETWGEVQNEMQDEEQDDEQDDEEDEEDIPPEPGVVWEVQDQYDSI